MLDVLIIGAGPSGLNCAIEAHKAGLNYLVVEKGVLVNSIYDFPINMTFFSTSQRLEIAQIPFISHADKPTRKEALEYYRRLHQVFDLKVNLYEEVLRMEAGSAQAYTIYTNKQTYKAQSVIVATGFYDTPRLMHVAGEDLPKVSHYYKDPHPYIGQKLLIVGAANSACDVALESYHKGAEVTMAVRESEIYPKVKYWIKPNIDNRIAEGSIKAYFNTQVKAIYEDRVLLENEEQGEFEIANDFVLAMTGYHPNYELLGRLGLHCEKDEFELPIHQKDTLESHLPNVYLAGVVCAGKQTSKLFIENTRDHGAIIIKQIMEKQAATKA